MMMEDSVRPSIQTMMVGGTVNLVERLVHESCYSKTIYIYINSCCKFAVYFFSDNCLSDMYSNMVFLFYLTWNSSVPCFHVHAFIFSNAVSPLRMYCIFQYSFALGLWRDNMHGVLKVKFSIGRRKLILLFSLTSLVHETKCY